jgi:(p)ppGpp synthase/HD superfamily hydrolase
MLAEITSVISDLHANIKNIEAQSEDQRGLVHVTIEVADLKHLEKTIGSIKKIRGITEITWQ